MTIYKKFFYAAFILIFILLTAYVFHNLNTAKLIEALRHVSWKWAFVVLLLNLLNTWLEALRWKLILDSLKGKVRVSRTFAALLVGVVGNTILPFRIGDGARAYYLARKEKISPVSSFSTIMVDRVADVLAFLLLCVFTAFFFPFPVLVGYLQANLRILGLGGILQKRNCRSLRSRIFGWLLSRFNELRLGLSSLRDRRLLVKIFFLSGLSWLIRLIMVDTMLRGFGLQLPVVAVPVILILENLGIAAVNVPANMGAFELATVAALRLFSVDFETAVSYSIVLHLLEVVPILISGIVILLISGTESKEILRADRQ